MATPFGTILGSIYGVVAAFIVAFWDVLSGLWPGWRRALFIVQPETVIRWHRRGFRYYWKWKSRPILPGRPRVTPEVQDLIRQMSLANPLWGAPHIHGEMLKLGIDISQASVSKYMVKPDRPPSQSWRTFLVNHARDTISIDFFTVPTASFRVVYVFLILDNARRKILHFNVTESPTAIWTGQQIVEAFPWDTAPRFLIRDRDGKYGFEFSPRVEALGIEQVLISPHSPWQNPYVERVIGSIRRECLDHVIVFGEDHLRRILGEYFRYYHRWRTHRSLEMDTPDGRPVQSRELGEVIQMPEVGGLHNHYERQAA